MRRKLFILVICILGLNGCARHNHESATYSELVGNFMKVKVSEIYEMQENEISFFLYTGRESCEYCVEFVYELSHAAEHMGIEIYYLDSVTEYEQSSEELKQFRDLYDIKYVPSLIYFEGAKLNTRFDNEQEYSEKYFVEFIEKSLDE